MFMAIKNPDGTIYKLNGPIPVMVDQERWGDFHVHNFDWNSIVEEDKSTVKPQHSDFGQLKKEGFVEELEKTKPEIKVTESNSVELIDTPPVETPEPVVDVIQETSSEPPQIKQRDLPIGLKKTFVYCLPAVISERVDELYGDKFTTIKYERPFSLEAVIVENSDLRLQMWTTIDKIKRGSILFPRLEEKRWWRVEEIEEKSGGFLIKGVPSDYQPSFNSQTL